MQPETPAPIPPPPPIPPIQTAAPLPTTPPAAPLTPQSSNRYSASDSDLLEPGELIVTIVHRNPIGIIAIYLEVLVGCIALAAVFLIVSPSFFNNLSGQAYGLMIAMALLAVALIAMVLFVATYIYRQCRLVVTNKSLVQIIQKGLFIRKISRLSMSNVEDVTADHEGFLATIFNFGTLTIQTAGEEDNFVFPFCPRPDYYAEQVLDARQAYARSVEEANETGKPLI